MINQKFKQKKPNNFCLKLCYFQEDLTVDINETEVRPYRSKKKNYILTGDPSTFLLFSTVLNTFRLCFRLMSVATFLSKKNRRCPNFYKTFFIKPHLHQMSKLYIYVITFFCKKILILAYACYTHLFMSKRHFSQTCLAIEEAFNVTSSCRSSLKSEQHFS